MVVCECGRSVGERPLTDARSSPFSCVSAPLWHSSRRGLLALIGPTMYMDQWIDRCRGNRTRCFSYRALGVDQMNGWMVRGESDRMLLVGRRDNLGARRGRMDGCMPGESDRMLLIGRRDNLGARPGPNGPMDDAGGTNQTGRFFLLDVGITLARGVDQWTGAGGNRMFFYWTPG